MPRLDQLRPEDFESLLGERLQIEIPGDIVACELTEVRRLPRHTLRAGTPFALTLRGPRDRPFRQGIHPLRHPDHGRLDVFMVPIGADGAGLCYEVTFN